MAHDISPAEQAELHSPQNELPDSHAHHLHEFGHVDRLVHVAASHSSADEIHPVAPVSNKSPLARNERWRRLARRLYRPRHLMQYFFNDTLYRTRDIRRVSSEELFLDLVIVAAVASLGHELRAQPISWRSVEKFLLLFAAVYQSWRQAVFLWNLWGVHQDLIEKSGIYLTFVSIVGIAIGAHGAFDDGIRPYVAVSAFLATAIPTSGAVVWAFQERLLKNPANRANQLLISGIFVIFSVLPYLAAAFVSTDTAARALYWTAFGIQPFAAYGPYLTYSRLHRKIPNHTRLAFNIELIVEKFEVLTMIVLGETVIGLLFEGNGIVTSEGARVGLLYVTAIAGTAILYSFQTLYVQVDGPIPRGGTHAVRHNGYVGIAWGLFHMPYHFFLIAFATGLAILVRDVALPPAEAARQLIRAGEVATSAASFDDSARWLFAVGWGGSMIFSATIGAMHIPGPRAATKLHRIAIRVVISIAIMVGMPFADVSAGVYLGVFTIVTVILSMLEFLFVQMDRIGFFKSEASAFASTDSGPDGMRIADWTSDSSDSDEVDVEAGRGASGGDESEQLLGESCQDDFYLELKERMCKGHCSRLVAEKKKQKKCAKPENVDKDTL